MENVPDVIGTNNIKHFASWLAKLESFGYHCYWKVLNGRDYGIPQNRERCFMISILGDYLYEWPQIMPLTNKLRDLLEDEVDEKYYLSDKMLAYCTDMTNRNGFVRGERFSPIDTDKKDYGYAITTSAGQRPTDNFIVIKGKECPIVKDNENYIQWKQEGLLDSDCRAWRDDKVSGTLTTSDKQKVLENQSLKKQLCNDLIASGKVKENDVIRHSYSNSRMKEWETRGCETNNMSPTLDTRCDCLGVVNNCRIRKLTPKECFRLMGVKDEDFERIAKNQSNASLYHLAGDSIIVDVLMALFKQIV